MLTKKFCVSGWRILVINAELKETTFAITFCTKTLIPIKEKFEKTKMRPEEKVMNRKGKINGRN